ncbi:hypothetical protein [Brevibacterium sp. FME17]|nr:hypothetical protein [Brevibacterium sp. FME17]
MEPRPDHLGCFDCRKRRIEAMDQGSGDMGKDGVSVKLIGI